MYSETYRPSKLSEVFGHFEKKEKLKKYLESYFKGSVFLVGSPGIGKTTLALTSANTFGFDPLEINASNSLRSYEDVDRLRDSCRGSINIHSFLIGDIKRKTCVILDELDGSDPHAQNKIIEWIKDPERKVPIICTGNELPTIIKRNDSLIKILRCFPPSIEDIKVIFPETDIQSILKECQNDIRRVFNRIQYGNSYVIPRYILPPTGTHIEKAFTDVQRMFEIPDPLEYLYDKLDNEHLH
jgi:DNA polymerase III delta prime subunit